VHSVQAAASRLEMVNRTKHGRTVSMIATREYLRGKYHCTVDLLFDWFVLVCLQIKTKIVSCHTADSKTVEQEVNGTVILPPLVFPETTIVIHANNNMDANVYLD
jgi:hypothetical protein